MTLVPNATVRSFNLAGDRIRSVSVERNGQLEEVTADFYVAAMPVEIMQGLVTPELARAAPSLARLGELRTEWMNGIQFYLETDQPLADGHAIYPRLELGAHLDLAAAVLARLRLVAVRQRTRGRHPLGRHLELDRPGNFNGKPAMAATSARRSRTKCGRS